MLFGLALVINVGSVSAANQSSTTVQSHTTVQSAVTTSKNVTTTVKKSTTTKVSTNSYGLTTAQIKDGLKRTQNFYNNNNRLPNYVSYGTKKIPIASFQKILKAYGLKIVVKTSNAKVSTNSYGLTTAQIKDGLKRTQNFYNNNNRLPNYVSYGTKKIPIASFQKILKAYGLKILVKTYANGWVTVKNLVYDHQDTSYTCGPSSLKMELSDYGLKLNEMTLASYASSNSNVGTTHSGLINAVNKVNSIYGTKLSAWDSNFSSVGWAGLYKYISTNHPVILHIRSFLNPNTSGHYVVLMGLNMNSGLVKIADPSYGYRTLSFSSLLSRMNWVVSTGRTTKPLIFVK